VIVSVFSAIDVSSGQEVQIKVEDQGLVAKGGWATVHRGRMLPDGEIIAIKQVKETKQYKVSRFWVDKLIVAPRDGNPSVANST
jgi:hypothetical protein